MNINTDKLDDVYLLYSLEAHHERLTINITENKFIPSNAYWTKAPFFIKYSQLFK